MVYGIRIQKDSVYGIVYCIWYKDSEGFSICIWYKDSEGFSIWYMV